MSALLEIRGLCAFYGRTQVLFGLDLDVAEGGVTTLLGANGAGKTTTLRAVSGMLRTTGDIRFAGERIAGRAIEDIVRLGIAHAPEGRGTFVRQTVEENLQIGAMARNGRAASCAATSPSGDRISAIRGARWNCCCTRCWPGWPPAASMPVWRLPWS